MEPPNLLGLAKATSGISSKQPPEKDRSREISAPLSDDRTWPRTPNRGTVAIILPSLAMGCTAVPRRRGDPFQIYCRPGDAALSPITLPRSRPEGDKRTIQERMSAASTLMHCTIVAASAETVMRAIRYNDRVVVATYDRL